MNHVEELRFMSSYTYQGFLYIFYSLVPFIIGFSTIKRALLKRKVFLLSLLSPFLILITKLFLIYILHVVRNLKVKRRDGLVFWAPVVLLHVFALATGPRFEGRAFH